MLLWLFLVPWLGPSLGTARPQEENFEIVNGDIVEDPAELPFLCRIQIHGSHQSSFCGAALVSDEHLVSAKHCVDVDRCYVACRDLNRAGHDVGEFRVSILDVFFKSGISDLAVIQLKEKVQKHKDYGKGVPITPAKLATKEPEPGDEVLTAGWGLTGYKEGPSDQLRKLKLSVTTVDKLWVRTGVTNSEGNVSDPCKGDSGGPLLILRENNWEVAGTLKVDYQSLWF